MIEGSLSRRYAKALFQLALEGQIEEDIGQEIGRFATAYTNSPLVTVLNNPAFGVMSRKNIVVQVAKELQLSPLSIHFLSLLIDQDRLTYLPSILARYCRLLDEAQGRVEAQVVAIGPLEEVVLKELREVLQKISGKKVVLHQETDPGLIGGALIQLEGKIYDGSVRTQLERMRERVGRGY